MKPTFLRRWSPLFAVVFTVLMSPQLSRADWASTIAAENPLHWFQFEETSGTTAVDSGSAGANGVYENGVTLGQPGVVGLGARFDGVDDHVFVDGPDLTGDWTAEFIVAVGDGGASQGLKGSPTMALKAEQWNDTGTIGYTNFGVVDVDLGVPMPSELSHVVFVQTGAGVDLYVNGALAANDATTAVLGRQVIGAGRRNADLSIVDPLDGIIDELVAYDRALSADTIAAHYAAIPEPSSIVLAGLAALGMLSVLGRRYRR